MESRKGILCLSLDVFCSGCLNGPRRRLKVPGTGRYRVRAPTRSTRGSTQYLIPGPQRLSEMVCPSPPRTFEDKNIQSVARSSIYRIRSSALKVVDRLSLLRKLSFFSFPVFRAVVLPEASLVLCETHQTSETSYLYSRDRSTHLTKRRLNIVSLKHSKKLRSRDCILATSTDRRFIKSSGQ